MRPADEHAAIARIERVRARGPRLIEEVVTTAHGAGGIASAALVENVFVDAFRGDDTSHPLATLGDAALLDAPTGRVALTTDSYVVQPIEFPGGSIGHLAVHGTINDLAVSGAQPRWLSAAFVLEEGLPIADLRRIVDDMASAAREAGVTIVTGDTKVVPRGAADRLYITTAGVGVVPSGRDLGAHRVRDGDVLLVSGAIGAHGMAVMLARGGLGLEAPELRSDTRAVHHLVEALLEAAPGTAWMRDATRGGLGTVACELARDTGLSVELAEADLPVAPVVAGACDILGIDPLYVANEGCFVAVVPADEADAAVAALRALPGGAEAAVVGRIGVDPPAQVTLATPYGGLRMVEPLVGDPLPRIC
ncbi:MAG: hydrogenase expression/formation protein HypE [Mobilicoccus sp.]|nr:hydrogenase expression/formation protein HypE [Mobilicoccus sp.]